MPAKKRGETTRRCRQGWGTGSTYLEDAANAERPIALVGTLTARHHTQELPLRPRESGGQDAKERPLKIED